MGYEDQMSLYAYVRNDPINATDPSGKFLLKLATIGMDIVDLGADLAAGNYRDAAVTALTILDPTGVSGPQVDRLAEDKRV